MRDMKDSGVVWIGEIPSFWRIGMVKQYFDVIKNLSRDGEPTRVLKLARSGIVEKDVTQNEGQMAASYEGYNKVCVGDLLLNPMDLYSGANCNVSPIEGVISPAYTNLRLKGQSGNSKFFDYFFKMQYWTMAMFAHGKGVSFDNRWTLNNDTLKAYSIPIPDSAEQDKIVTYLDTKCTQIDALIVNVQTQIEKLKSYKQSVITEVVTKGLDSTVPMKDSGVEWIGAAPAHWSIIPSKFLFANCVERRRVNDVQLTASQKYGMISQEEYMRRENTRIVLADQGLESWKHVEPFDFVISLRSFQGGLEMSEVAGCATWHYIVLRARQEIHPYYYKWLFKSSKYITALQRTCNYIRDGQDLRYSNFVKVPLCIPLLEEQHEIADYLDKKFAQIDELISIKQTKIDKLNEYKKSLIYEYVTGKKEA